MEFREHLDDELGIMHQELASGAIRIGDYHFFTIHDPKERVICAASFRERVLQHAIMTVCEPVFEKYQIFDSFACRKNKGMDACLRRLQEMCRRYRWYLKLDIEKYFDSISHDVLKRLLSRHFKDRRLLELFGEIIDSYETTSGCGIPIGNLTSQYFANMYLGAMDHQIKEVLKVPGFVRYMDDFVLFSSEKEVLGHALEAVKAFLRESLMLELHPPQINRTERGIPMLSYRIFGTHLRLSLKAKRRFCAKAGEALACRSRGHLLPLLAFVQRAESDGFIRKWAAENRDLFDVKV